MQVVKLTNVIQPHGSGCKVTPGTGKVNVKLQKWFDHNEWRHLADTGQHPATDSLAHALQKSNKKENEPKDSKEKET